MNSQQRCIVIDGASNITVYDNVGVNTYGHCFYAGFQSEDNLFERNLASQIKSISWSKTIEGESDYYAAAFYSRFAPNSFVNSVAAGNQNDGFYFSNNWYTKDEVSSTQSSHIVHAISPNSVVGTTISYTDITGSVTDFACNCSRIYYGSIPSLVTMLKKVIHAAYRSAHSEATSLTPTVSAVWFFWIFNSLVLSSLGITPPSKTGITVFICVAHETQSSVV